MSLTTFTLSCMTNSSPTSSSAKSRRSASSWIPSAWASRRLSRSTSPSSNACSGSFARREFHGVARITEAFRDRYYDIVKRTLAEKRQIIPCLAGVASAQIAPNGDVWACCIRAESMGNLRDHNYDFRSVWTTAEAAEQRRSIKARECYCPLANASYTNMLCHVPTLTSVGLEVAKEHDSGQASFRQKRQIRQAAQPARHQRGGRCAPAQRRLQRQREWEGGAGARTTRPQRLASGSHH